MKKNLADEIVKNSSILALGTLTSDKDKSVTTRTLFICAMPEELEGFRQALVFLQIPYVAQCSRKYGYFYTFTYAGNCCTAVAVGITYFNIGRLAKLDVPNHYDEVICFGTLAGIADQPIGEVVVSNNVVCNDLYLSNFGYIDGTVRKCPVRSIGPLMVSGSKFLSDKKEKKAVKQRFPGAYTFDMETFIFTEFFRTLDVPFICMKAVSDNGEEEPEGSFEENVTFVSSISAVYALSFIEKSSVRNLLNKGGKK